MSIETIPHSDKSLRFVVRANDNGKKVGVYDYVDGCYHGAGPLLRAVGIEHLDWFTGGTLAERVEKAQAVADLLNEHHGGTIAPKRGKAKAAAPKADSEDSLHSMADALIADQS